jgi:hypothetical protein
LARGGKHGSVLKPGNPAASALVRRVELPVEEKEHMPPRGKPQLSDDDLTLVEWWVGAGAPREQRVATLDLPSSVQVILEGRLAGAAEAPPDRAATLAAAQRLSSSLGLIIRPLSPDGPWVDVNARLLGKAFGDRELALLAPIAPAVMWLDIGNTSVTDAGLAALDPMRRLQRLHLDQLKVGDAGLERLAHLRQLEYLNLRATLVTDKGLPVLRTLPRLRSLYLWQTSVTPGAAKALGDAMIDKRRIARWKEDQTELGREIQAEQFETNMGEELRPVPKPIVNSEEKKPAATDKPIIAP